MSASKQASPNEPDSGPRVYWSHLHLIVYLLVVGSVFTICVGVLLYWFVALDIPDLKALRSYRPPVTTFILDSQGEILEGLSKENRILVPYDRIPDLLARAFVAAEDARFFEHAGLDAWSIIRAFIHNLQSGERGQGGSTITQQVARDLLLSPEKTYTRKLKEAILAYRIDSALTKEDILYIYLNQIYLGAGSYGVEAAARTYFGKHIGELNLAEMAILAGLPQAPSRYSPLKHFARAKARQAYVLNRMAEEGYITPEAARAAYKQALFWAPPQKTHEDDGYFLQYVRNYAEQKYGRERLYTGGLIIRTTLDRRQQKAATAAVVAGLAQWKARHPGRRPPEAALVALETGTGMVRAMVGGTNYAESPFDRAVQGRRQPGSAFKPFVYATALMHGFTPATLITDAPIKLPGAQRGKFWEPHNYDGKFHGPTTVRTGLITSNNIVTIKLLQAVGTKPVIALAGELGIQSPLTKNLSLALGVSDVSLLELTAAYSAFANGGKRVEPIFITKITDSDGRVIEENKPRLKQVLDKGVALQVTSLLKGVVEEGTGRGVRALGLPAAGKTGTTNDYMDAWFVGFTPELAAGVWMGYDQKTSLGDKETGARAASPVWLAFMSGIKSTLSGRDFEPPEGITFATTDGPTGEISGDSEAGDGNKTAVEAPSQENLPQQPTAPTTGE
ncbi:MAG: PBP1A family penicillin-binding protein [Desulfobacteraceae bacterium]|nr:PBP1A family penicillin-binding protein [Desulfobacteraceae bacterium]